MPYNTALEDKIDDITLSWDSFEKKKMFGGICYLLNGNMCFGVWKDYLIVRMAPELAAEKLNNDYVRAFDITGKPMRGWVMVEKGSWDKTVELAKWLKLGDHLHLTCQINRPKENHLKRYTIRITDKVRKDMVMKPLLTIVAILLLGISAAHLVRIIFQIEMTVGGFIVPVWVSIFGVIIPLVLALLLWRENRKEFIKTQLSPLEITREKTNNKAVKKATPTLTILKK